MPNTKPSASFTISHRVFLIITFILSFGVMAFCALFSFAPSLKQADVHAINSHDARWYEPAWYNENLENELLVLPGGQAIAVGSFLQDAALTLDSSLLFYAVGENEQALSLYVTDFFDNPVLIAENVSEYHFSPVNGWVYYVAQNSGSSPLFLYNGKSSVQLAPSAQNFVVSSNDAFVFFKDEEILYTVAVGGQPQILMHDTLGILPLAISANGRIVYYAAPGTQGNTLLLQREEIRSGGANHTLSIPADTRVRIALNYAGTEPVVSCEDGLFTYTPYSGFSKIDEGNAQLYFGGTRLSAYYTQQLQVSSFACTDFSSFLYGYPQENGYLSLHMAGTNQKGILVAPRVAGIQINKNNKQFYFLQDDTLYKSTLFAGRFAVPQKIAENVAHFAASSENNTVAYLVTESRHAATGTLHLSSGRFSSRVIASDVTPLFSLSAGGEYLAYLVDPDLYTGTADAYITTPAENSTVLIDTDVASLYGLTQNGELLYSKGLRNHNTNDYSLAFVDLFSYRYEDEESGLIEEELYMYQK